MGHSKVERKKRRKAKADEKEKFISELRNDWVEAKGVIEKLINDTKKQEYTMDDVIKGLEEESSDTESLLNQARNMRDTVTTINTEATELKTVMDKVYLPKVINDDLVSHIIDLGLKTATLKQAYSTVSMDWVTIVAKVFSIDANEK